MILEEIVCYKKKEVELRKKEKPLKVLEKEIEKQSRPRGFVEKKEKIQLIAELKKASPSKGIIREDFNPAALAKECVDSGASALSVLTEEKYFKGELSYIRLVKDITHVPVLRKDFIIDEYQILESRAYGADAVLLLANILGLDQLKKYLKLAGELGLKCLTEAHTEEELKKVLDTSAEIIGINNRDLKTFNVDLRNTERLIPKIPKGKMKVSESGISKRSDVEYLERLGIDAVLVGTSIMTSADVKSKIKELLGYG